MPFSKNINTYGDVVQVLTAARAQGGVSTYTLYSKGAAVMWRSRAYFYRTLLTKLAKERAGSVRGFVPTTDWDDMLLIAEGNAVKISFGRVSGRLTDEKGASIPTPPVERVSEGDAEIILNTVPQVETSNEDFALDDSALNEEAMRLRRMLE